jgi:hypothetical protein
MACRECDDNKKARDAARALVRELRDTISRRPPLSVDGRWLIDLAALLTRIDAQPWVREGA